MGFIQGEGRTQGRLFPATCDEPIPEVHVGRVIDAFVDRLDMAGLEFEGAGTSRTGAARVRSARSVEALCVGRRGASTNKKSLPNGRLSSEEGIVRCPFVLKMLTARAPVRWCWSWTPAAQDHSSAG